MNIDTYSLSTDGIKIEDDHIKCSCVACEKPFKLYYSAFQPEEEDLALDYAKSKGAKFVKKLIIHRIEDLTINEQKIVFSLAKSYSNQLRTMSCCQKCFISYLTYVLSACDLYNMYWAEQILSSGKSTDEFELMDFILTQSLFFSSRTLPGLQTGSMHYSYDFGLAAGRALRISCLRNPARSKPRSAGLSTG